MNILRRLSSGILLLLVLFHGSCKKGVPEKSGIAFTFDDHYILQWYNARDLFNEYGIKATFFINRPQNLLAEDIIMLKQLENDGHEIACHSMNHIDLIDFLSNHTVNDYINQEVIPAIEIMNQFGFKVSAYAYPYGKSTPESDKELLKYFKVLRKATYNIENTEINKIDRIFTKINSSRVVDAMGIDSGYGISLENLENGMIRAKRNNEVLVVYAHCIEQKELGSNISREYLKQAFELSKKQHLNAVTFSNLKN